MIYNFRIDRSLRGEILNRLKEEKVLSQGWGGGIKEDLRINKNDFIERCKSHHELATTRVPTNLRRIMDFKDGDILVTPHLPADGKVSIHFVKGNFPECYTYLDNDPSWQNHRISISSSYGLNEQICVDNVELASWFGKLPWLRLPVLPIPDDENNFRTIVEAIKHNPAARFDRSPIDEYIQRCADEIVDALQKELQRIRASNTVISFESICEELLKADGYTIDGRHIYDSKGGDIDFRCSRKRKGLSPFELGEKVLCVQVKKHTDTSDHYGVNQLTQMMAKTPGADGCVMSLADKFTDEAVKLADREGILLMNGKDICRLFLARLVVKKFV